MMRSFLIMGLLLNSFFSTGQALVEYYSQGASEPPPVANPAIQINFSRFTSSVPGWNHAGGDPTQTGQHIADLKDEYGNYTGVSLWVDSASNTSSHYSGGPHYADWPSGVNERAWRADSPGSFTISLRGLEVGGFYGLEMYTSHASYHNPTVTYTIDGIANIYENVNQSGHGLYSTNILTQSNGTLTIKVSSDGVYATIAGLRIYKN